MTLHVLIAEDAQDVAEAVAFGARMTWPGCRVTVVTSGAECLTTFATTGADVVILDLMLPPPDGFAVCRQIRESSEVPILMLTVRDATVDKVRALELGADDYLTKPFDPLELFARLRALLRRSNGYGEALSPDIACGDLSLDFTTQVVRVGESVIRLTPTEYRLLEELARHAGTVVPPQILLERVWGPTYVHDIHYLKVFVRRLRRKLGDPAAHPRYIQTEWGIGYRFGSRR